MIRTAAAVAVAASLLACSGSAGDEAAPASSLVETTTTAPDTTAAPDYRGDPDSAFCAGVRDAAERPLLDPFEAGIDAGEIELRMRALVVRFGQLADQAPSELAEDLGAVAGALRTLDAALAENGYDLGAAGDAGVDLSALDDPRFLDVAIRVDAYTEQVCRPG